MDFIKYFDFFSIKFNFYTNNQPNYQNIFGGIMSFIYILICIGVFILFSYEDLSRLNPSSTISEIPDSKSKIVNMNEEKIWIPFRIVTKEKKFIDHRGILNIFPYYVEGKYNKDIGMDLKYHLLNLKLCNETLMANFSKNYKIEAPLDELFCIEKDNLSFGGNWNDKFINYLEINLYLCKDEIYFNSSDQRCREISEFIKNINTSLLFDFYYPIVQFQPTNFKRPMEIIYKNYIYKLSTYSYKIEKLYIHEHILSDDKSFINTNYKNISYWGISSLYGDDYFLTSQIDPIDISKSSKIFTMEIYMDNGLVYYTRTYKKLILIISNVFPIFRFVLYFIKNFTQHVKITLTKRKLVGLIFENIESNPKKLIQKKVESLTKESSINDINNQIIELNKGKDKNIIRNLGQKIENNIDQKENYFNKSNINLKNENNAIKILNRKELILNEKIKPKELQYSSKMKELTLKKNNNIIKKKRAKYIFPYYYFFLDFLFDKLINPQSFFCIKKAYFTVYNFMCQIYDISTHIILFNQFNLLNNMVLEKVFEENGICPTKPYNKININDSQIVQKLHRDLKYKKSILFSNNLL